MNTILRRKEAMPAYIRALALVPLALAAVAFGAQATFADRVLPGVRVDGVDVGGLSLAEARDRLALRSASLGEQSVVLRVGEREWRARYDELGVTVDPLAGADAAFAVGHAGNVLERIASIGVTLLGHADVSMPRAGGDRLTRFLDGIAREVDRAPVDGAIAIAPDGVRVTEPQTGARLPTERILAAILAPGPAASRTIDATPETLAPEIGPAAIESAAAQAKAAFAPLKISAAGGAVDVDAARVAALVRIEKETASGEVRLVARVDPAAMDALIGEIAAKLDQPARDATVRASGAGVEVVPARDGVALDRDALRAALTDALFADDHGRSLSPVVVTMAPHLTTQTMQEYAARMTLLTTYTTYFPVNPSRATNIRIGASRFNGLVVPPGATFSFWNDIGDVSPASGFVESGAIIDGRSDKALGGGLCQVSTTLFNAVARSGYQIDERGPHSYYIERYPIGLDAAVALPGQDFTWTNDTPYPVLIRSSATATSVSFSLYTVPSGRVTSFSAPTERNLAMPSKGQYADPAYPKGYVVRGRDVWVTRTVTQNGGVVRRDTFYSHYAPVWGGTATSLTIR